MIKLIFKQARKYGVACVLATQNVSDVDYKILAQANTTFVGRFSQPQDIEKVRHLLKESGSDVDLVSQLPTLDAGQFQVVAPDVDPHPFPLQCRWLYTDHGAPLSEDQVEDITAPEIRAWARQRSSGTHRKTGGGRGAAAAAVRGSSWQNGSITSGEDEGSIIAQVRRKAVGGMAAAATGIVDDSAFEVRLIGGLAVLKDGRDPLYVMQAMANVASLIALSWSMLALLFAWRDADLSWIWLVVGAGVSGLAGLVIALELFLSHDATLLHRLSKFARGFQLLVICWLWGLISWAHWGTLNLLGGDIVLEITVVWTSLFFAIEVLHRFRLGRLSWEGSSAMKKLVGLSALLSEAEITDMRASSTQILSGLRWIMHGVMLVWGVCLLILVLAGGESIELTATQSWWWNHTTLWLMSVLGLMFLSEGWLRIRGKMPEQHL